MTIKKQQMLRIARNQCPEHNGETFCICQGYPEHSGPHRYMPVDERFQVVYPEAGEWKCEMRVPERVGGSYGTAG